ncbi:SDR family NAD(P)-dependent oxidoreductase [Actinomadura sp. WMMA1423]|uniref:SDR family NAD(P)-dependent oxidoreductase n=1 Tax=Actinomadura sp. WMMA1423 TaxID=2591108 RepID=UPI00114617C8|nr:SDR family NAD(P)-dependent oxidoreductase [Actinomadura sp. WMMA1423]
MNDGPPGPLLLTGASGTVGAAIARAISAAGLGEAVALGRTPPWPNVSGARFWPVDLADPDEVTELAAGITAGPPVRALVAAAGLDSRARLGDFSPQAAAECMQVNAWAHVAVLAAALDSRVGTTGGPLPVVLVSSDVTTGRSGSVAEAGVPGTLVYAAAKAAAEEALRHAVADAPPPGMALLIIRLPDIGVPMRAAAPGPPPPPRDGGLPRPVLGAAVNAITSFIRGPRPPLEVWNA